MAADKEAVGLSRVYYVYESKYYSARTAMTFLGQLIEMVLVCECSVQRDAHVFCVAFTLDYVSIAPNLELAIG